MRLFWIALYYGLLRYLPDEAEHSIFRIFNRMRSAAAKRLLKKCGEGINVHQNVYFGQGHNIEIGSYSHLGVNCSLASRGGVVIGNYVLMGPDILILTGKHIFTDIDVPILQQGMEYEKVEIGNDVWIGARVIILPGVKIGDKSIIGSGSVVTSDVAPGDIVGGVPARQIRNRLRESRDAS